MTNKLVMIVASSDKEVLLHMALLYSLNAAKKKWMDEVKVIFFGPSEKLAVHDEEVQKMIKDLQTAGVEVMACKWCSDEWKISELLEAQGITVVHVGPIISQFIKDGWATLSF